MNDESLPKESLFFFFAEILVKEKKKENWNELAIDCRSASLISGAGRARGLIITR